MEFAYDYRQVYLYDAAMKWSDDSDEYLRALDDAERRGSTVGLAGGLVDIVMPRQDNFHCQLGVETSNSAPGLEGRDDWDHVVEFSVLLPTGKLVLEGSGGCEKSQVDLAPGLFRARWSGRNFVAAADWNYGDEDNPPDEYRLQLWPEVAQGPPRELKRWDGFD